MLPLKDYERFNSIIVEETGYGPENVRLEDGWLYFETTLGEEKTQDLCLSLMNDHGLQSTPDDGQPEYFLNFAEGAQRVFVRWRIDMDRPIFSEVE